MSIAHFTATVQALRAHDIALSPFDVERRVLGNPPATASCSLSMLANGTMQIGGVGTLIGIPPTQWYGAAPETGVGSRYEVRLTVNSGTMDSGDATGVWLALSSTRTWTIENSATLGTETVDFDLEIRVAATGGVVDSSAGNTMDATRELDV